MAQGLDALTREELIELLEITAKDLSRWTARGSMSLDRRPGAWTAGHGSTTARPGDASVPSEARSLKKLLGLSIAAVSEGLAEALPLRCTSLANEWEIRWEDDGSLAFRITDAPRAKRRKRKGMDFHPCKSVGELEYAGFAAGLDDRIQCECVSCYPAIADDTCNCAWRFRMEG